MHIRKKARNYLQKKIDLIYLIRYSALAQARLKLRIKDYFKE